MRSVLALLTAALVVPASAFAQSGYDVTIRRTAHGIPHITARDFGSLGYGYGYAFARDNLCVMAEQYVTVRGERSRWFGPDGTWRMGGNGTTNRNLDSDFFFKRIIARGTIEKLLSQPPPNGPRPEVREAVRGYVAGYNRYLADTGVDRLPDPACRGEGWVRRIEEIDAYRRFYQLALLASSGVAIDGIGGAQPPPPGDLGGMPRVGGADDGPDDGPDGGPDDAAEQLADAFPLDIGSNAVGLGREQTDNGKGLLLGNPHFPWDGTERFYQAHATIPGVMDVQGAALFGVPVVLIGHTRGLAWSHTVSTAFRFTPFELTLVPGSPTTYLVDGVPKEMERDELVVDVRRPDGSIGQVRRTLYTTEYGPVFTELLGLPLFPWTPVKAWAMGDANAQNFRYLNHFLETNLAQSVREFDQVLRRNQGIPWVNSIAADSTGEAYYADIGVVPHVTDEHAQRCNTALGVATTQLLGLPVLDGSRSSCNWGRDPSAIQPGTLGPDEHLPSLLRPDYVMNSNDSYWLSNLRAPLEGFPRIVGDERTERSLRTRIGLKMIDGQRFSQRSLQDMVFDNRQYAGELWRGALVEVCDTIPGYADACAALRGWDLHDDVGSRGALLFRGIARRLLEPAGGLVALPPWTTPFSAGDPVNTPRGLNALDPRVRLAIIGATDELRSLGIPLDAPLGAVQRERRGDELLPIHGGPGGLGVFNAIQPGDPAKPRIGHDDIVHGSSYVQVVQFTDRGCPVEPRTILTYSQSTNSESPFSADQTRLYGAKTWVDVPFCEDEVRAATVSQVRLRSGDEGGAVSRCPERLPVGARRRGRRVTFTGPPGTRVEIFRAEGGRRIGRGRSFRARRSGVYVARFRRGRSTRRLAFAVRRGRVRMLPRYERVSPCGPLRYAKLRSPLLRPRRATLALRVGERADVTVHVRRGRRTVRRVQGTLRRGRTYRLRLARHLRRGAHRVTIAAHGPSGTVRWTLRARAVA